VRGNLAGGGQVWLAGVMAEPSEYVIGLDLGGSSVKWLAAGGDGQSLDRGNVAFDPERPMHWAEEIRAVVRKVSAGRHEVLKGIGISAPGLAARDGRSIAFMPGRLAGLENLVWQDFLGTTFAIPVLNDAHSALLGEAWIGAAAGKRNVVMLTLGTGVGGAAMVDGRLLLGNIQRAGSLGHVCLDANGPVDVTNMPGSLEMMIGNCSIVERSHGRFKTTHELIAAHNSGDAGATTVWLKSVRDLACAVASFINVLDPEVVIIGGGIAAAGKALFEALEGYMRPMEWQPGGHQVPIAAATLGEFAGAFGAAKRAWDRP
jgi:glucokinase